MKKKLANQSLSQVREYRRMSNDELTGRLHDLQYSLLPEKLVNARETEMLAVLQELEIYQIELEIQNRELRESQQALEASQDRYLNLYDFAPVGYLTLNDQGVIEELNLTAAAMFGVERSWLTGRALASWVLGTDLPLLRDHLKNCRNSGEKTTSSFYIRLRNKQILPVELSTTPSNDSATGVVFFRSTLTDITERKRLEAELTFERRKIETFFLDSPASMVLWRGPDFIFEMVNPVYQAIFPGRALTGRPFLEALPEYKDQIFFGLLTRVLDTGESFIGREVLAQIQATPNGSLENRYYDFSYVRILDPNGNPYGVLCHAVDVSAKVESRKALETSRAKLDDSVRELVQEREVRERFVMALSHDLRTPMTSAKLAAELLVRSCENPESICKLSSRIVDSIDRADHMIHDLLDANRLKAGEGIPISIRECRMDLLLEKAVLILRELHGPRFQLHNPMGDFKGHWDSSNLQRVIENLGSNAVKYGEICAPIQITLTQDEADWVELSVHNEGQPISVQDQAFLFNPYRRTDTAVKGGQKGWGVGLTLVKGIAEAHGGTVRVKSGPGIGTTFTVRLPLDCRARSPKCTNPQ